MYCTKKIASDLVWVGANDRRLAMFEGVYSVPAGVSYNSYLLTDEKTVLFDTVDKAVSRTFFENLEHELGGRPLDYVIVHHMEPDHSATLSELLLRHPETAVVCNDKTAVMIAQFFGTRTSSANTACRYRISSRRSRVWTFRCSARCTASSGGVISDIFWKSTTSGAPIRRRTRA